MIRWSSLEYKPMWWGKGIMKFIKKWDWWLLEFIIITFKLSCMDVASNFTTKGASNMIGHLCGRAFLQNSFSIKGLKVTSAILCLVLRPQGVPWCKNLKFPSFFSRDTSVLGHLQGSYDVALDLNIGLSIENAFSVAKMIESKLQIHQKICLLSTSFSRNGEIS